MTPKEQLFSLSANPQEALNQWERYLEAYLATTHQPFKTDYSIHNPFLRLFGNSSFLIRYLIKNPQVTDFILSSPYLIKEKELSHFLEEIEALSFETLEGWLSLVRRYKYQELFRITLKDFSDAPPEQILKEISDLAQAILTSVDRKIYNSSKEKWGSPLLTNGHECSYHILGLGKLGGRELNYSSDIDLIAFIESDNGTAGELSLHEFFVRHFQQLTYVLQSETSDGFLYRVDWDLRPEGKAGTLVNSLSALETYYEVFGAEWERQALTKGRPMAGSLSLGEEFLRKITPFVYRKHLDIEGIQRIQEMKKRIHEDLDKKHKQGFNVKLGIGGIREIEFFAQAFLLLYGGRISELKSTNTLTVLFQLGERKLVSLSDIKVLTEGYLFLRKLEHRLQLVDEKQTHLLSLDPGEQLKTARRMGYLQETSLEALQSFTKDLERHTSQVHRLFEGLFSDRKEETKTHQSVEPPPPDTSHYRIILQNRLSHWPQLEDKLDEIRYFKKDEFKTVSKLEENPLFPRKEILKRLSFIAESIVQEALNLAMAEVEKIYGKASYQRGSKETGLAYVMPVAMGKLGGFEINYRSDLDLIFIFSEQGETTGPKKITSSEYFARLVQKFISILSLTTRAGSAFAIDTELRPSGHFGPLVTSLESFMTYQRTASQIWERQALLKGRPLAYPPPFARLIKNHLDALLFSSSFPDEIRHEMHRLRMRVEKEIAKESADYFDFKGGKGGVMDIEFILQFLQLRYGSEYEMLRASSTFDGLEKLSELNLLPQKDTALLSEAYAFYRTFESKLQLKMDRAIHRLSRKNIILQNIAEDLRLGTSKNLFDKYICFSKEIRKIYDKVFVGKNYSS